VAVCGAVGAGLGGVVRASSVGVWFGLLVLLLVAGPAHGQEPADPALEAARERLDEEGMDLVRVTRSRALPCWSRGLRRGAHGGLPDDS